MKIIDLLNKIANGEEVPKVIEYQGTFYYFNGIDYVLYIDENIDYCSDDCLTRYINANMLNDEVKIIEEQEDKKIKKINMEWFKQVDMFDHKNIEIAIQMLSQQLNELIDELNKLKGDKNER